VIKCQKDIDEIKSIIQAADALQRRLDKLTARQTFTVEQELAVRSAADKMRNIRGWELSILRIQFDEEYAEKMKRLTIAAKRGGIVIRTEPD